MRKVPLPSLGSQHRYHHARLNILENASSQSPTTDFGLCELLPKRTWIVGDSYVHPNWYVKRQRARCQRPWQATGMRHAWRAKKLVDDLEAKKSGDLGFGDLDKRHFLSPKELDDPRLFKFESSQQPNEVLTDPVYEFSTFHTPIKGDFPLDDPHVFYQRPKYNDPDTPLDPPKRPPQPVTVKALMVDNQVTAFVTCRANQKGDHTSDRVFKLLEETLGKCKTLLPRDEFVVLPPKGKDTNKVHGPDPSAPNKTQSKKKKKVKKSGKTKPKTKKKEALIKPLPVPERSPSQVERERYSAMRSQEIPDHAWYGEPGTPLELAPDLLKLRELKGQKRRTAAEQILLMQSTKEEIFEARRWRCLAKKHWKYKRQRNILERYLYEGERNPIIRKKNGNRRETLLVESETSDENNVFGSLERLEALRETTSEQLPQTAFRTDFRPELSDAHLPNIKNLACRTNKGNDNTGDSDWIDEHEFSKLADDPVAEQRYASSQASLKLRTAASGANILSSLMGNEHFMSEKNARKLARAFRRLGLCNVQTNKHISCESEFVSAVPFVVVHTFEEDQLCREPFLDSVAIGRNQCGEEVKRSRVNENVEVCCQKSTLEEASRPLCANQAIPAKKYKENAKSEWDFLHKLIESGGNAAGGSVTPIDKGGRKEISRAIAAQIPQELP